MSEGDTGTEREGEMSGIPSEKQKAKAGQGERAGPPTGPAPPRTDSKQAGRPGLPGASLGAPPDARPFLSFCGQ